MLRIHRNHGGLVLPCERHHQCSCGHECLLVGEGHGLSGLEGRHHRLEPAEAHHRSQNHIDGLGGHQVADRLHTREDLDIVRLECLRHLGVLVGVADHHIVGLETDCLFYEEGRVVVGREKFYFEEILVLSHRVKGLRAYRPGGTEYGDVSFSVRCHLRTLCNRQGR